MLWKEMRRKGMRWNGMWWNGMRREQEILDTTERKIRIRRGKIAIQGEAVKDNVIYILNLYKC
jgi:hypothetical protein